MQEVEDDEGVEEKEGAKMEEVRGGGRPGGEATKFKEASSEGLNKMKPI